MTRINDLTIIVPISDMHNRLEQLSSWLFNINLYPNFEVILIHDFADLETELELQTIVSSIKSNQIQILTGLFRGVGNARNIGIPLVKTNWMIFVDSDDWINLENVSKILSEKDLIQFDLVISNYSVQNPTQLQENVLIEDDDFDIRLGLNPGIWRHIIKTSFAKDIRFENYRMGEDVLYLCELRYLKPKIALRNINTYTYFTGNPRQSTANFSKFREIPKVLENLKSLNNEIKPDLFISTCILLLEKNYISSQPMYLKQLVLLKLLCARDLNLKFLLRVFLIRYGRK